MLENYGVNGCAGQCKASPCMPKLLIRNILGRGLHGRKRRAPLVIPTRPGFTPPPFDPNPAPGFAPLPLSSRTRPRFLSIATCHPEPGPGSTPLPLVIPNPAPVCGDGGEGPAFSPPPEQKTRTKTDPSSASLSASRERSPRTYDARLPPRRYVSPSRCAQSLHAAHS